MTRGVHLPRVTLSCAQCGKEFSRVGSDTNRTHCSWECAKKSRIKPLPPRPCKGCGKTFTPKSHHRQTYCRKGCVSESKARRNREAGIFHSSREAKAALLGQAKRCQRCGWDGEPGVLELHHRDRNTRNNHLSNLEVLCPNCHAIDHYKAKDGQFKNNLGR